MPGEYYWPRLPTEIRIQIYKYLLPEKHTFIIVHNKSRPVLIKGCYHNNKRVGECIPTALFYISKQISGEIRDLLFASNTFALHAGIFVEDLSEGCIVRYNYSVGVSQFLKVLTLETLRSIQHLEILIHSTRTTTGPNFKRIYDWMCKLTSVLEQQHSLKTLNVRCLYSENPWQIDSWEPNGSVLMPRPYILEALVPLFGIKNVTFEGVDQVFAAKLRSVMMDCKPRKLRELNYPEIHYKRRKVNSVRYVQDIKSTTRKYYDQHYDWDEVEV